MEKRKHERISRKIKSEVRSKDTMTFSSTLDMSNGGLFISTPEPLSAGTEISLTLTMPGEEPVEVEGVVKWIYEGEEKNGMGIEFKGDTKNYNAIIKKISSK